MLSDSNKEFLDAYIYCALWSSTDENGNYFDGGNADLPPKTLEVMKADCQAFLDLADELLNLKYSQAGHDFWLTRNGHGTGFRDGDWPENGDKLTEISEGFEEVNLYIGDDGLIYQFPG